MKSLNATPLNGLRAIEAMQRLGTLHAVADELGVSPGAVSQQIARCEEAVGRKLFDRRPGGMQPRPGTEDIFRLLNTGFDRLSAAADLMRRDRQTALTVSVAPIFAARWLIWRLPDFTRAHPDIRVRIDSDMKLIDPNDGSIDCAIRIGPGPYPGVEAEPLFDQRILPICSAEIAARLTHPRDLLSVPIIREPAAMYNWSAWLGPEGIDEKRLPDGPLFNEASLCLDAAMTGAGVFLGFETLVADALKRGQIAAPFPVWRKTGSRYWLITARDRSLTTPQRRFRSWLKAAIEAEGLGTAEVPRA
ncbi:LysR substrate-binding domain-containing protein [Pseudooceanicola sp. C21-150M6]|uniref:LysR substrate-binding domain-containing protein n=1 Tax=Pseudooceanicola sp. C21-150M6 TaxID=3434355 RepID=UPI003D7FA225